MQLHEFFELRSREIRGTACFVPRQRSQGSAFFRSLRLGERTECEPVELRALRGTDIPDFVSNGPLLLIVSKRVVELLKEKELTGWRPFPVRLYDRGNAPIHGEYFGLGITGRAGALDEERSVTQWATDEDGTRTGILGLRGLHFDADEWDGSDFFLLKGRGFFLVTPRVADALKGAGITGWEATPVLEFRMG